MRVYYCQKFCSLYSQFQHLLTLQYLQGACPVHTRDCTLKVRTLAHVPYMGSMHNICYRQEMRGKRVHLRIYIEWF